MQAPCPDSGLENENTGNNHGAGHQHALSCSAAVSAATARTQLRSFLDTYRPDGFIITSMIYSHASRAWSFEIKVKDLGDQVEGSVAGSNGPLQSFERDAE